MKKIKNLIKTIVENVLNENDLHKLKSFPSWWVVECPIDYKENQKWQSIITFIQSFKPTDERDVIKNVEVGRFYGLKVEKYTPKFFSTTYTPKVKEQINIYPTDIEYKYTNEEGLKVFSLNEVYDIIINL